MKGDSYWKRNGRGTRPKDPNAKTPPWKLSQQRRWRTENPLRYMVNMCRSRAKMRGIEFRITVADLGEPPEFCPVLGMRLKYFGESTKGGPDSASIDRIVNSEGYVPGNVMIISRRANELKRDATPEELRRLADFYS